jgi:hypothetical protein
MINNNMTEEYETEKSNQGFAFVKPRAAGVQ